MYGKGNYSIVYKAIDKTNNSLIALKLISKNIHPYHFKYINNEIQILSKIKHPSII